MINTLLVGIGGFIGAILRFLLSGWVQGLLQHTGFPAGTLTVNLIGCLLIGAATGWIELSTDFPPEFKFFFVIGLLGSFTTFSTFGNDTLSLFQNERILMAWGNMAVHLLLGLTAVVAGRSTINWLIR
jgi:CrcB protein